MGNWITDPLTSTLLFLYDLMWILHFKEGVKGERWMSVKSENLKILEEVAAVIVKLKNL